eukprot:TRINITY_DN44147_c0_g1_i2.p1 TRINITY_DN44147_c0_g1~~TRINITY_DN44147_c0_g1_i2.p1  ORF type:complete len:320 (-),score=50.98 TRINITY_DN44147_c0_g1_i2:214-1173(-)
MICTFLMSVLFFCSVLFFFFKQKTAYEMLRSLVGSEMCIRDSPKPLPTTGLFRGSSSPTLPLQRPTPSRRPNFPRFLYHWIQHVLGRSNNEGVLPGTFPSNEICVEDVRVMTALLSNWDVAGIVYDAAHGSQELVRCFDQAHIEFQGSREPLLWHQQSLYPDLVARMCWGLITKFELSVSVDSSFPCYIREVMGKDSLRAWSSVLTLHRFNKKVENFERSWRDGLPFWALLAHVDPKMRPFSSHVSSEPQDLDNWVGNLQAAFRGLAVIGIPQMLDPTEVAKCESLDWPLKDQIVLYVALVFNHCLKNHIPPWETSESA